MRVDGHEWGAVLWPEEGDEPFSPTVWSHTEDGDAAAARRAAHRMKLRWIRFGGLRLHLLATLVVGFISAVIFGGWGLLAGLFAGLLTWALLALKVPHTVGPLKMNDSL